MTTTRVRAISGAITGEVLGGSGPVERAVREAIARADWFKDTDKPLGELILGYAKLLDDPEKQTYYRVKMGPHMLEALKEAAFTPAQRMLIMGTDVKVSGRLAAMRAAKAGA